jgi:hypothetical protein
MVRSRPSGSRSGRAFRPVFPAARDWVSDPPSTR